MKGCAHIFSLYTGINDAGYEFLSSSLTLLSPIMLAVSAFYCGILLFFCRPNNSITPVMNQEAIK
jgi:hypothetical protein